MHFGGRGVNGQLKFESAKSARPPTLPGGGIGAGIYCFVTVKPVTMASVLWAKRIP